MRIPANVPQQTTLTYTRIIERMIKRQISPSGLKLECLTRKQRHALRQRLYRSMKANNVNKVYKILERDDGLIIVPDELTITNR